MDETSPVGVRNAGPADADAIVRLLDDLEYPTSAEQYAGRFGRLTQDQASWLFVAELDGRVVGLAALHVMPLIERDEPLGRLTAIVVEGASRNSGIGRALVKHVETRARREGCTRLELTSHYRRDEAHAFYRRLGFEDTSRRFIKQID